MPACSSCPPSVRQALADADLPSDRLAVADSIELLPALEGVPDPRRRRGRRHGLQSILLLAVGAVLAGARSYAAIADWAAHADHAVTLCGPTPHATTFGRVLGAVDADALEQVLTGWVLTRRARLAGQRAGDREPAAAARQVLAVDGKTLRGARDQTGDGSGDGPSWWPSPTTATGSCSPRPESPAAMSSLPSPRPWPPCPTCRMS